MCLRPTPSLHDALPILAEKGGFRAGDAIQSLAGQPPLSIGDVQWVLQQVPASGGSVKALVKRGGKITEVTLGLPEGWRNLDDIAWRASSWELRRMGLGAMLLKPMTAEQRAEQKVPAMGMALRVEHVGQFRPRDIARKAGV